MSQALGRPEGVLNVELDLPTATFAVEVAEDARVDPDVFRSIVESWDPYGYKVGEIEILT